MTEQRIGSDTLAHVLECLDVYVHDLGPAGAFDAVLTMRVDGRASLEWLDANGRCIARTRQFHRKDDDGKWVEHVADGGG